ncbi:MAG: hypothetical protein KatS3mg111_1839 [Pirellulaceae bacterium]|nr:MAG: hypothetical protein KatS3mg111_1839 [Pirellulaceae bacterium]
MGKTKRRPEPVPFHRSRRRQVAKRAPLRAGLAGVLLVILTLGSWLAWTDYRRATQIAALSARTQTALRAGKWDVAEQYASQWAMLDVMNPEAWMAAAEAAWGQGRAEAAVAYLTQIPAPAPLEAYHLKGYLEMEALHDPQACLATCETTLQHYPDDRETHHRLLYYFTMTCQSAPLREEVQRSMTTGSDSLTTYAYLLSHQWLRFNNGTEITKLWLERYPEEETYQVAAVLNLIEHPLLEEILRASRASAEDEPRPREFGEQQVRQLLDRFPHNLELLATEIRNQCRHGDVVEVARLLMRAPPEAVEDNRFWRFKGWVHSVEQEWDEAADSYRKSLQLAPWDWATQWELATLIRVTEGVEAAKEMQRLADMGRQLVIGIRQSKNIHELTPPSLYRQIADYLRACGEKEMANRVEDLLNRSAQAGSLQP